MPSIFEQLAAAGVELSDEQKAAIKLDEADEVKGLKSKVDQLLTEKKQAKSQAEQAAEAARIAQEESARKTGDVQALEQSLAKKYQSEIERRDAEIQKRDVRILGGAKSGVIAELSGKFVAPDAAKLMLGSLVDVSYDEKGEVVTVFKGLDGQPVGTSAKDFEAYLAKEKAFAPMLVGTTSTGGGAPGSAGRGGAAAKKFADMTGSELVALRRENPTEYARLAAESKQTT